MTERIAQLEKQVADLTEIVDRLLIREMNVGPKWHANDRWLVDVAHRALARKGLLTSGGMTSEDFERYFSELRGERAGAA